jgi:hypothetical protein
LPLVGGDQERKETAPFFFPSCCEEAAIVFTIQLGNGARLKLSEPN